MFQSSLLEKRDYNKLEGRSGLPPSFLSLSLSNFSLQFSLSLISHFNFLSLSLRYSLNEKGEKVREELKRVQRFESRKLIKREMNEGERGWETKRKKELRERERKTSFQFVTYLA